MTPNPPQSARMPEVRFIEHHGKIVRDPRTPYGFKTINEHWIVNGKRFNHEPKDHEIEAAFSITRTPAADLTLPKDKLQGWIEATNASLSAFKAAKADIATAALLLNHVGRTQSEVTQNRLSILIDMNELALAEMREMVKP